MKQRGDFVWSTRTTNCQVFVGGSIEEEPTLCFAGFLIHVLRQVLHDGLESRIASEFGDLATNVGFDSCQN